MKLKLQPVKIKVSELSELLKIQDMGITSLYNFEEVKQLASLKQFNDLLLWMSVHSMDDYNSLIFGRYNIENTIEHAVMDLTVECTTLNHSIYGGVVSYKGVMLWGTIYSDILTSGTEIALVSGDSDEPYTIIGKTPVIGLPGYYDYSTYGDWDTLEEAKAWLDNPTPLY